MRGFSTFSLLHDSKVAQSTPHYLSLFSCENGLRDSETYKASCTGFAVNVDPVLTRGLVEVAASILIKASAHGQVLIVRKERS